MNQYLLNYLLRMPWYDFKYSQVCPYLNQTHCTIHIYTIIHRNKRQTADLTLTLQIIYWGIPKGVWIMSVALAVTDFSVCQFMLGWKYILRTVWCFVWLDHLGVICWSMWILWLVKTGRSAVNFYRLCSVHDGTFLLKKFLRYQLCQQPMMVHLEILKCLLHYISAGSFAYTPQTLECQGKEEFW